MFRRSCRAHGRITRCSGLLVGIFCICGLSREVRGCERPQGCCETLLQDYIDILVGSELPHIVTDYLGNEIRIVKESPECTNPCEDNSGSVAYKMYYNGAFVGECPYVGGTNAWLYRPQYGGAPPLFSFACLLHRSVDDYCGDGCITGTDPMSGQPNVLFCDDNCNSARDWVVNVYDCLTMTAYRYWREGPCSSYPGLESAGWDELSEEPGHEVRTSDADCGRICGPGYENCTSGN